MANQPKPDKKDPIALAKSALAGVLDRAIASKDDDRILASAKQLLATLDRPAASTDAMPPVQDRWVNWTTAEEMNVLKSALDSIDAIERAAKARRELGGDPPEIHLIRAGSGQAYWRDTPETSEESRTYYQQSKAQTLANVAGTV